MAATFVDLETHRAIRIAARESSKDLARQLHPEIENKNQQQMAAYREMSDQDLFDEQWVQVTLDAKEFPGYKGERVACAQCGEGINYDRFLVRDGETCASPVPRRRTDTTSRFPNPDSLSGSRPLRQRVRRSLHQNASPGFVSQWVIPATIFRREQICRKFPPGSQSPCKCRQGT